MKTGVHGNWDYDKRMPRLATRADLKRLSKGKTMNFCPSCNQIEGDTRETDDGVIECADCGDEVRRIPEHDDYDMER